MSAVGTLSPARKKRDALTRKVLDAALELFAEAGYHGTTIPKVMERAGVGAGSLYRLFESKEALVNAAYRDAKGRLKDALHTGVSFDRPPRAIWSDIWKRLAAFAEAEPVTFRFLELQDHVPYLDGESRQLEHSFLAPMVLAVMDFQRQGVFRKDLTPDVVIAFAWGAFVGLVKAQRLGYIALGGASLEAARDACWRAFETDESAKATHNRSS